MRLPVKLCFALSAPLLIAGCQSGGSGIASAPSVADNGPQDDYPVVLGDPFTIDGVTYTPEDVMNFDAVGLAVAEGGQGPGVTGAHKTLPLPSYVEVTNLDTGRTVLVRITSRGPMRSDALIGLSPAATAELGLAETPMVAVRVRRVNPPEVERAMLRAGDPVPPRMDTPVALLGALKRKLAGETGTKPNMAPPVAAVPVTDGDEPVLAARPPVPVEAGAGNPAESPAGKGTFVQLGAFSNEANARKAAASVDAGVHKSGRYWVARLGPLSGRAQTDAALAKARAAGYGEAIVRRVN
jgi:rare lipoprotein A